MVFEPLQRFFQWTNGLPFTDTLNSWIAATGMDPIAIGGALAFVVIAYLNNRKN